jgi:CRP/FNR family cyclic AMP-dependent transcriptional regulator
VAGPSSRPGRGGFLDLLATDDREALIRLGRPTHFQRGARFVFQGDDSDNVFILLRGRIKVTLTTAAGHEIVLAVIGAGEVLGEFEAIAGGPRTASNVALEPIECRVLTAAEFLGFLDAHPRAGVLLLQSIIHRLRAADRRRTDSGSLDTPHRLARLLLEVIDQQPDRDAVEIDVDIPLTQEELASLIASSRESVVRGLAALRARQLITTGRRRITVRDIPSLRAYAGL